MKRTVLALTATTVAVVLWCGVALAATLNGEPGPDALRGTDAPDRIDGNGGPDSILGLGAVDLLIGDTGDDAVAGGSGDDNLKGGPGGDALNGGSSDDAVNGGLGEDEVLGGAGNARIHSQDLHDTGIGDRDLVDCGAGRDRVSADFEDRVADSCESVVVGGF